jgi:hypothetical protein
MAKFKVLRDPTNTSFCAFLFCPSSHGSYESVNDYENNFLATYLCDFIVLHRLRYTLFRDHENHYEIRVNMLLDEGLNNSEQLQITLNILIRLFNFVLTSLVNNLGCRLKTCEPSICNVKALQQKRPGEAIEGGAQENNLRGTFRVTLPNGLTGSLSK